MNHETGREPSRQVVPLTPTEMPDIRGSNTPAAHTRSQPVTGVEEETVNGKHLEAMLVKENRNVGEERRKAGKGLEQYYTKESVFHSTFESNWQIHVEDYLKNCNHRDAHDTKKVVFFRYSLAHNSDTRQYYDGIINAAKKAAHL